MELGTHVIVMLAEEIEGALGAIGPLATRKDTKQRREIRKNIKM